MYYQDFQIFVKPISSLCNLRCQYCYYIEKSELYPDESDFKMPMSILEEFIVQNIEATNRQSVRFSWHGGEPTLLGLNYFKKIIELQEKHRPSGVRILNGLQTNGTLLDDSWCRFLAENNFSVGLSLDGPKGMHDTYRRKSDGKATYDDVIRGYKLLKKHGISAEILCVVNDHNVKHPLEVYRYFKQLDAQYITFLPLVEAINGSISPRSVPSEKWGEFLCMIFDEWLQEDIGRVKIQVIEEALRIAFKQEHSLCIFRPICGDIPVLEHNGDFYQCDHFVDPEHYLGNIQETPLLELLMSPEQKAFGEAKRETLPSVCVECDVRDMCNGECPKNRLIKSPQGESGLNYLCSGYKRFFTHCKPFIKEVARLWEKGNSI